MAERLIDALADVWDPERYEDRYRDAVMALIERKAAGATIDIPQLKAPEPVPDLLAALQQSVEQSTKRKPSRPRTGAPAAPRGKSPAEPRQAKSSAKPREAKSPPATRTRRAKAG